MIRFSLHKQLQGQSGSLFLDVDMDIREGEIITLYGPSGAGKTSILRMLSGLLSPDKGRIEVGDEVWFDSENRINRNPQKRKIGYMLQENTLFPNMTVQENIAFGMSQEGIQTTDQLLELFDLTTLRNKNPETLSGGQKQRVALARAIGRRPHLLMLDEPFSSLDDEMRRKLQDTILSIHKQFNLAVLLVSHDVGEIFRLSKEVVKIHQGKVILKGPVSTVFSSQKLSGKFQFPGEILSISQEGVIHIISVLVGNHITKVVVDKTEASNLAIGDKVLVASKAFNPIIKKI